MVVLVVKLTVAISVEVVYNRVVDVGVLHAVGLFIGVLPGQWFCC